MKTTERLLEYREQYKKMCGVFSERYNELKNKNRLTSAEIAKALGISRQTITYWSMADRIPTMPILIELAGILGTSIEYLLGLTDSKYLRKKVTMEKSNETAKTRYILIGTDYPINLLDAVDGDYWKFNIPSDINGTVEYALKTFLSAREADVLRERFINGKTCSEIGKSNGVSLERIRQIEQKALKKLREPERLKYLQHGIAGIIQYSVNNAVEKAHQGELARAVEVLEEFCGRENPLAKAREMKLVDLNLSTRTFNCLAKEGIKTLGDIEKFTPKEIKRIRNLGTYCYDEIIGIANRYGIKPKEDK